MLLNPGAIMKQPLQKSKLGDASVPYQVLVVDDEEDLLELVRYNLSRDGYKVTCVATGEEAFRSARKQTPDLIVLDLMLPGVDGLEVCRRLKSEPKTRDIPIIMLTAKSEESDMVAGLERGADDYITKPFRLAELLLKVKRTLARCAMFEAEEAVSTGTLIWGPFELDSEKLEIKTPAGQSVLTRLEADMLKEFFLNPDRVLSRQHLLAKVWGVSEGVETRTVDNFVVRLRRLIEANPANPRYLKSIRGRGYVLAP